MNEQQYKESGNHVRHIVRAGVTLSSLSIYSASIKFEVSQPLPRNWLHYLKVQLHGEGLGRTYALRASDTVGRYYQAYLELDGGVHHARLSSVSSPNLLRCTMITLHMSGYSQELPNDETIFCALGE